MIKEEKTKDNSIWLNADHYNKTGRFNKEFTKYEYETKGKKTFGGYYPNDIDPTDSKNRKHKLSGTTTVIGSNLVAYGDMISPGFMFWMDKLSRKERKDSTDIFYTEQTDFEKASAGIAYATMIAQQALEKLGDDGNLAEEMLYGMLQTYQKNGFIEQGSTITKKINKAYHYATLCLEELIKLGKDIKIISYQEGISDSELQDIGFFDFVLEIDGLTYLVDMKTGKRVKDKKLLAVKYQLLGSYKPKWEGFYGKKIDKVIVLCGVEDEITFTVGVKRWKTFAEVVDLTDLDPNGIFKEEYEMAAKLRKAQIQSGNLKNLKKIVETVL